jgi:hypothetical protein
VTDITDRLLERANSYEQSGPSAHHTAALLREANDEIERLRCILVNVALAIGHNYSPIAVIQD